jgi:hypothetical protein
VREQSSSLGESTTDQATCLINAVISNTDALSADSLTSTLEEELRERELVNGNVEQYLKSLRENCHGMMVNQLPKGVGGECRAGDITIATETLLIGTDGISDAMGKIEEVAAHEQYHQNHRHTVRHYETMNAEHNVTIAGTIFQIHELMEGLVVYDTGHDFVSAEYQGHERRLMNAVDASENITMDNVREAVNVTGDLTTIDDRSLSMTRTH